MTRVIVLAFFFLMIEIYGLEKVFHELYKQELWKLNFYSSSQRRVFKVIENIRNAPPQSIFVLGGSASREFFTIDENMSKDLNTTFFNCAVSSESIFDSLKLYSLVEENNTIIYGIHPRTLYDYGIEQTTEGYYLGGAYFKYPIFIENLKSLIQGKHMPSNLQMLSPEFNTYLYLIKEYVKSIAIQIKRNKNVSFTTNKVPKQYFYSVPPEKEEVLEKKLKKYFKESSKTMKKNLLLNITLLENLVQLSLEKNNKLILFELPFSPMTQEYFKPYFPAYYQAIDYLLKKYPDIIFISNTSLPNARQTLFFDTIHLLPEGRDYYHKASIKSLKQALQP